MESIVEALDENGSLAAAGLAVGAAFGFLALRSRFCLRSVISGLVFDLGLVPGAFVAASPFGELGLEGVRGGASMRRHIVGAVLTGFGGMLAGGRAVGAGLPGTAIFTMTSWVTLCAMWAAAAVTDRLVDGRPSGALDQSVPGSQVFRPRGAI